MMVCKGIQRVGDGATFDQGQEGANRGVVEGEQEGDTGRSVTGGMSIS